MTESKPPEFALVVGDRGIVWILVVNGKTITDGFGSEDRAWLEELSCELNLAATAHVEKEVRRAVEEFRERAIKTMIRGCVVCEGEGFTSESEHVCGGDGGVCVRACPREPQRQCSACESSVEIIRALPLEVEEEK